MRNLFPLFSPLQKMVTGLAAAAVFALVLCVGGWFSLKVTKQQFETEARNIVTALQSSMSVVDGLSTSLQASGHSDSVLNNEQLSSHMAAVLANYEFVVGLGRFNQIMFMDRIAEDHHFGEDANGEETHSGAWHFSRSGDAVAVKPGSGLYYPITQAKTRADSKNESFDLAGFDLASLPETLSSIRNRGASDRFVVMSVPRQWPRPNNLWVFRTKSNNDQTVGGYLIEIDIDKMASSGGVELNGFGLSLSKFSEQGEFEAQGRADTLYARTDNSTESNLVWTSTSDNRWLSSFNGGDKTLLVEVNKETGFSAKLLGILLGCALILAAMLLAIVHLNARRLMAIEQQRAASERLFQAKNSAAVTLASITDAVITTDTSNHILYANNAAEALLGYTDGSMLSRSIDDIIVPLTKRSGDTEDDTLVLKSVSGSSIYVNKNESDLIDSEGVESGKVIVLRDISVERELTRALEHKVNHDSLTGLSNRLNFEQQLTALFEHSKSDLLTGISVPTVSSESENTDAPTHSIFYIDLDRFKEVNDTCGHAAGDELLIKVSKVFMENVREYDLVARLGGDEFGILLRECSTTDAITVAERIREFFQSFFFEYDGQMFPVRCSIGICHFNPATCELEQALRVGDAACFDAKNSGRNSICIRNVDDDLSNVPVEEQWLPRIKDALANDLFELHVQGISSIASGEVGSYEILLRMSDSRGSVVAAEAFMKTALRYDLALEIDKWVVTTSLAKISELTSEFSSLGFSINVSNQSLESIEFLQFLQLQITRSGIEPSRLCFDIKENDVLNNPASVSNFCREMRAMGCRIALDDFGGGMTSLGTLKTLPIDELKIDGSLIVHLGDAPSVTVQHANSSACPSGSQDLSEECLVNPDQVLVKSIQSFASSMGVKTIAEQVDSAACLEVCKNIKLDYLQGFAVAYPESFDVFVSGYGDNSCADQQRAA